MNTVAEKLSHLLGDVRTEVPVAPLTTFKIGGNAEFYFEAKTRKDLAKALTASKTLGIPYTVLGGGSNVLIGDGGIPGLTIRNMSREIKLRGMKGNMNAGKKDSRVFVDTDSGVLMNQLVRYTVEQGLAGLEMHLGLPGTVGGAIYMNSKWNHPPGYVGDVLYQADLFTADGQIKTVARPYFRFAYDYSVLQQTGEIVLGVVFALTPADKQKLWETANESVRYRRSSQPQGIRSAGCTFRNISEAQAIASNTPGNTQSAGFLIDHAGLKGSVSGNAQISPVHANFIINNGQATARDVVELIELSRNNVKKRFGVTLEEEIVRLGKF
jgi:UDP-N-acetylenolpyruvoylglucosamine reductase